MVREYSMQSGTICQSPLISVIVPIYNVAAYLPRCLDSIIGQTYPNLEIILVDDGSPDACPKICDEYAAKDKRIKVIHQKNKGLPASRNVGLDCAHGEFVAFVDSDDWLDTTCYEQLLKRQQEADMVFCGLYFAWDTRTQEHLFAMQHQPGFLTPEQFLLFLIQQGNFSSWNKLYRRSWVGQTRFDARYTIAEDWTFVSQLAKKGGRVAQINVPLYFYYQRPDSMLRTGGFYGRYLAVQLQQKLYSEFKESSFQPLRIALLNLLLSTTNFACMSALFDKQENSDRVWQMRQILAEHKKRILFAPTIGPAGKSFAFSFIFFPRVTKWVCRLPGVNGWLKKSFVRHAGK